MKKVLKISAFFILFVALVLTALILWLTFTDYRPPLVEAAEYDNGRGNHLNKEISILNWNIGYGGLGSNMDFFMDGGTRVRAPEEEYSEYWKGITSFLQNRSEDILFLQEVDRRSTRSYKQDQYREISQFYPDYSRSFATNYKVKFIPSPSIIGRQYGSVLSGLATYSRFPFDYSERHSLPGNYSWPKSVFFLDRCLLVSKITTDFESDIVLINAHMSAYDKGGFLKKEQLYFIKDLAEKEYKNGNYVIIGGDWNSYMPGTDGLTFESSEEIPDFYQTLPEDWNMEGWQWAVDKSTPTNRSLATPYEEGENFLTVIDGFLLSPNVELLSVNTIDLGFLYSDHNPIEIRVILQ